jgi:poly-D-alanine transfer protein DltD
LQARRKNKMSTKEKLIARFKALPSDFTFEELDRLLNNLGYEKDNKGKTSGSRVVYKDKDNTPIMLHKPHPGNIIKKYAMKQIYDELKNKGKIK